MGDGPGMDGTSLSAIIDAIESCAVQLVNDAPPTLKVPAITGPDPCRAMQARRRAPGWEAR